MTEEIIIDGVDVAGCEFYECEMCSAYKDCGYTDIMCKYDNQDCYYKQLKRLEQENRELKEEKLYRGIDKQFIEDANDKLYWENKKYRSALEEIREILLLPDMPEVKEQTIITSTMLDEIVRAKRENKLQKIKQTIYEVLGND